MSKQIPAIVLGGTGYVSGELLRLILGHPNFTLAGVMSDSSPGELAGKSFPHLAGALADTVFKSQSDIAALIAAQPSAAVFCAAPHGAAAPGRTWSTSPRIFVLRLPRPMRRSTNIRTARRNGWPSSPARCPST